MRVQDRYIYIKNGDVVAQLMRIAASGEVGITSGPDAFLYDFLYRIRGAPVFVASRLNKDIRYQNGNTEAHVYKTDGNIFLKILRRIYSTLHLFVSIVSYRPTRILCGTAGSFLWIAFLFSRIYSVPIVFSCHNRINEQDRTPLKQMISRIDNWCIRKCHNVICHGPYLRDQLMAVGVAPGNLIEFDVGFYDLNNSLSVGAEITGISIMDRIILFVGRIERQKGVFDLLEACAEILTDMPDVFLVYIGKGSAYEELQSSSVRLGLKDKVRLLGYVRHDHIVDIMRRSLMVVAPTRLEFPEGRCMSAMEGMVMGLPVVAPDFGPFPYLVQDDVNGLLYKSNSRDDLRDKIRLLLTDGDRYIRLRSGARNTGIKLMKPDLTFGEAVCRAFNAQKL